MTGSELGNNSSVVAFRTISIFAFTASPDTTGNFLGRSAIYGEIIV